MSKLIQTGRFVITSDKKYLKVNDDNYWEWTDKIKEAEVFESERLAVVFKYANDVGECKIIELITKPKQK